MNREQLILHIEAKRDERGRHLAASAYVAALGNSLSEKSRKEITAVISSNVAACERSIRDHKRDLDNIDYPSWV